MSDRRAMRPRAASRRAAQSQAGKRTTTTRAYGQEALQEEEMTDNIFPEGIEPARVCVSSGGTHALGDFEFLKIEVSVTLPCMPTAEGIEAAYTRAKEFVSEKLINDQSEWLGTFYGQESSSAQPSPRKSSRRGEGNRGRTR